MKIGIICHSSFGGSARVATELALALAQRGHRVHLFTRTTPFGDLNYPGGVMLHTVVPEGEDDFHPARLYTEWPAGELQALVSRILDVIATEGLDVLHFHYAVPFAFVAAQVRHCLGQEAPVLVGTLHGTDVFIHGRDSVKGPQLSQALHHLDALTTVSVSHARLSAEVFELCTRPEVIFDFVNLSKFRPQNPLPTSPYEGDSFPPACGGDRGGGQGSSTSPTSDR